MPYLNNDNIKIYFEEHGDNTQPSILMNHGNGNCIDDWKQLGYIDEFKDYHLILVDARGFGKSDKPREPEAYVPDLITSDFVAVLNALKIEKCHYFGNSRGGSMGFLFATLHSNRFDTFCLCSGQPYGSKEARLSKDFIAWLEKGIEYFVEQLEKALEKPFPQKLRENFLKNDAQALIAANTLPWPDYSSNFAEGGTCCVPTLLIVGEKDPVLESNKKFMSSVKPPLVQLEILQGMTHADVYWQSHIIAKLAKCFYQSVIPKFK